MNRWLRFFLMSMVAFTLSTIGHLHGFVPALECFGVSVFVIHSGGR